MTDSMTDSMTHGTLRIWT